MFSVKKEEKKKVSLLVLRQIYTSADEPLEFFRQLRI